MKKWIQEQKQFKNERGLTLVELLAVIVILAIVATIAFVAIGKVMENSREDALVANALQMIESAKLYEASGGENTSEWTIDTLQKADVLETIYDPWTKTPITAATNTVTKDSNGKYSVILSGDKGMINASEDELLENGRGNVNSGTP